MNNKTKILIALNDYVRKAKKFELPALRIQCVQMIKMIDMRLYGKPAPIIKKKPLIKRLLERK